MVRSNIILISAVSCSLKCIIYVIISILGTFLAKLLPPIDAQVFSAKTPTVVCRKMMNQNRIESKVTDMAHIDL